MKPSSKAFQKKSAFTVEKRAFPRSNAQNFQPKNAFLPALRLQKVLAQKGLGSRRLIEEWVKAGRVQINGKIASLGDKVLPRDKVKVDGKLVEIKQSLSAQRPRFLIYHKPEGEIVSRNDPENRPSVFTRLPRLRGARWINVGRLDFNSSGLLIFTTSGEWANRLMHPSFAIEREYSVRVLGNLTPELRQQLLKGVQLEDGLARFLALEEVGGEGANRWYRVLLTEGKNKEVRRLFQAVGLTVSRLIRTRFGHITLPPRLKRGRFYEFNAKEVENLTRDFSFPR